MKNKIFAILAIVIVFVPLGLISSDPAWGEWENEYYKKAVGYIPKGIEDATSIVTPILPDYALEGGNEVLWYYVSAIFGALLLFCIFYILNKAFQNDKA